MSKRTVAVAANRPAFLAYVREQIDAKVREHPMAQVRIRGGTARVIYGDHDVLYVHAWSARVLAGVPGPVKLVWGHGYDPRRAEEIRNAVAVINTKYPTQEDL